jgi:hypothetical protein
MEAVDLTIAKNVLGQSANAQGVLDVFYEQHLDPACEADTALQQKVVEMDEIDLHGWVLRVLLPEYRRLGNQLHPADPDRRCVADAEAFARWLHRLAARKRGDETLPLSYDGTYLRVAVIWVAVPKKLEVHGSDPYRKRAKSLIYSGRYDAVYLMARDRNIWAVREIVEKLRVDGRIDSSSCNEFQLRSDFAKRRLNRDRTIVACLAPHSVRSVDQVPDEDLGEVEVERFDPTDEIKASRKERFFEKDPPDTVAVHDASSDSVDPGQKKYAQRADD